MFRRNLRTSRRTTNPRNPGRNPHARRVSTTLARNGRIQRRVNYWAQRSEETGFAIRRKFTTPDLTALRSVSGSLERGIVGKIATPIPRQSRISVSSFCETFLAARSQPALPAGRTCDGLKADGNYGGGSAAGNPSPDIPRDPTSPEIKVPSYWLKGVVKFTDTAMRRDRENSATPRRVSSAWTGDRRPSFGARRGKRSGDNVCPLVPLGRNTFFRSGYTRGTTLQPKGAMPPIQQTFLIRGGGLPFG
ncbi:hypothetical protein DBV15_02433 [Temnothorax longispinosus]|uniref:Uncharacterized protein n=1 Tax=Temnothorax longispinosus TaxID=300112 RepID=A0A4S2KW80_9HYME|nr:hypothetical protein DBV15_02433 [Temnothorax longispinosus]